MQSPGSIIFSFLSPEIYVINMMGAMMTFVKKKHDNPQYFFSLTSHKYTTLGFRFKSYKYPTDGFPAEGLDSG